MGNWTVKGSVTTFPSLLETLLVKF